MTPTQIIQRSRERYNSIGDSFYSDDEVLGLAYDACLMIATECKLIESTYTTTTVAGTQGYAYPTNVIDLKRVTYNGQKLKPITMRDDDMITILNQETSDTGTPQYYFIWSNTLYLRPVPASALALKLYTHNQPSEISTSSTLEIPSQFHMDIVTYCVSQMAAKDTNMTAAEYFDTKFEKAMLRMKRWAAKRKRGDSFASVQDEERTIGSYLGPV